MEVVRSIGGVVLLTLGVTQLVWLLRNFFRQRYNHPPAYRRYKGPIVLVGIFFCVVGILIHPTHNFLLGGILGVLAGLWFSR